jgi:hypothetical protein
MKLFLSKLKVRLLILLYSIEIKVEEFLDKFRTPNVTIEGSREQVQQQKQNQRLTSAVARITGAIYDEDGKLKDFAKKRGFDLAVLTKGTKRSPTEELKVIDIQRRILDKPIDESGTDEALVQHTIKNAPRYLLEQKRRERSKEYFRLLKLPPEEQNQNEVKRLYQEIQHLGAEIKRLKENS